MTTGGRRPWPRPPRHSSCATSSASRRTGPSRWGSSPPSPRSRGTPPVAAPLLRQRWTRPNGTASTGAWLTARRACGSLALGQGDLAAAASQFEQVVAVRLARGLRGPTVVSLPDLVEALVRL